MRIGRRRSQLRRPPTPPYVRFRIRRFMKSTGNEAVAPAAMVNVYDPASPLTHIVAGFGGNAEQMIKGVNVIDALFSWCARQGASH